MRAHANVWRWLAAFATIVCTGALAGAAEKAANAKNDPSPAAIHMKLPFPPGTRYSVLQGNHGKFSHHDAANEYAWDFDLPLGSPVTAAAGGRVVDIKQDSTTAGDDATKYSDDANYIEIDHGDGIFSAYLHLSPKSAKVSVGDVVKPGQVIALSGNSGFSSRPHLHFTLENYLGDSIPGRFTDFAEHAGVPAEDDKCYAGAVTRDVHRYQADSVLPEDAFAKNGIRLTSQLPARLWYPGEQYRVEGSVDHLVAGNGDRRAKHVVLFVMPHSGGNELEAFRGKIDEQGHFRYAISLAMPAKTWEKNPHDFSLAVAIEKSDGSYESKISVPITIFPKP